MKPSKDCRETVIIDFETTGISPQYERVIEVGAVVVKNREITETFTQLMNPGHPVPNFITRLTGISNQMLEGKPSPEKVMPMLKKFIGNRVVIAHNASFDRGFLISEMSRANLRLNNHFLCSVLLSRRLVSDSPNFKLGTLADHLGIQFRRRAHRALADVEVTADLWTYLYEVVRESTALKHPDYDIFHQISKKPKAKTFELLQKIAQQPVRA